MVNLIITYKSFIKFLDMICSAINYHLVMKKPRYFNFKFDYFAISLYTELFILRRSI